MALLLAIINLLCYAWYLLLLLRVLISWFDLSPYSAGGRIVVAATEPVLKPIRRALTPLQGRAGLDFSPVVAFVVVEALRRVIVAVLR